METINRPSSTKSSEPAGIKHRLDEEALLIHQVLAGQQDRFQELLQPHMSVVLRTVQTKMRNSAEVDDVIQETLLKALTRLAENASPNGTSCEYAHPACGFFIERLIDAGMKVYG